MVLTVLAIPFIILGAFVTPYALGAERCFNLNFLSKAPYCFEAASNMPEIVKYGSLIVGFALIYYGRYRMRQARGQQ